MSGVLEETTSREIDCDHVSRRVDDWADRIVALYSAIEGWLPADWSATRDKIRMYEEMMQKFNVSARELPLLKLSYRGKPAGRIEPRALWIIGANGRLDFFARSGHFLIVDTAENFQPSHWKIAPFTDRRNLKRLDKASFLSALLK